MIDGLESHLELIEQQLASSVPDKTPEPLKAAMHYAITAGGKRIRPLLALVACELLGGKKQHAIKTACAIEMIHTYSLIHDDLPAMDDDDLRRGKPTLHVVFNEATAILAGDALQSLAFEAISTDEDLNDSIRVQLMQLIARAIGPEGMVAGQVLDMKNEGQQVGGEALAEMHNRKTGDLIATSILAGACIAGATIEEQQCLATFGYELGLAFQIRDDLLDVIGTTEQLGKPQGSDEAQDKSTFTSIYGLEGAEAQLNEVRDRALAALKPLDNKAQSLVALTHFVVDRIH